MSNFSHSTVSILGLDFFNGEASDVVNILRSGGLLVVPAAPALVTIKDDLLYHQALINADLIIPDSGFMALIWNLRKKPKINRISGLEFLKKFLDKKEIHHPKKKMFIVNPNSIEEISNIKYLNKIGINISHKHSYIAPKYERHKVVDEKLLQILEEKKPAYIILNIGGGTQEKLGFYLKKNLSYKPAIICTGAALAFLTGHQASIPMWADRSYLGWFFRCMDKPKLYVPRYYNAIKLLKMMHKEN